MSHSYRVRARRLRLRNERHSLLFHSTKRCIPSGHQHHRKAGRRQTPHTFCSRRCLSIFCPFVSWSFINLMILFYTHTHTHRALHGQRLQSKRMGARVALENKVTANQPWLFGGARTRGSQMSKTPKPAQPACVKKRQRASKSVKWSVIEAALSLN